MASWIESHTVLMRHRKLADFARALRLRKAYALGHLHALWHAALEQAEDGDLSAWSDEFIAEQADFPGDAPQFVRLLQEHGWFGYRDAQGHLIPGTEKLIHDWPDYVGKFLMSRYSTSNRDKLVGIWAKHQRLYGDKKESKQKAGREPMATRKRVNSERTATLPNQPTDPNPQDQPNTPADAVRVAVGSKLGWEVRWTDDASAERSQIDLWLLDHGGNVDSLTDALLESVRANKRRPSKMSEVVGVHKITLAEKPAPRKRELAY